MDALLPLTYGLRKRGDSSVIGIIPPKIHANPPASEWFTKDYEEIGLFTEDQVSSLRSHVSTLKAGLAAIHCMADRAPPSVIRNQCEKLVPELLQLAKAPTNDQ